MARIHARTHGRSGSRRPTRENAPEWQGLDKQEIIETVEKLAREGNGGARIGLILRDQYGVPDIRAATGMKLKKILEEREVAPQLPEDLQNLLRRTVHLREHLRTHTQDRHNARSLHLLESKIRRLATYYKRTGALPADWKYSPKTAALIVD